MAEPSFADLIRRVRSCDEEAAHELVRLYEPEIRRIARIRLDDAHLRQLLDSTDICQSVLGNFFIRVASGQFELKSPEQLLKLLVTMACNKIHDKIRRQNAQRRRGSKELGGDQLDSVADPGSSPSQTAAARELLQTLRAHLSEEERYLADQRALGRGWTELGVELGVSPEAIRKRFTRAIDRVARQLGLEEVLDV